MANENVIIRRGLSTSTPETKIPGQILVETDTGTLYIDDTSESRVQVKDKTKLSIYGGELFGLLITGNVTPKSSGNYSIGSVDSHYNEIYASYFRGTADKATVLVTPRTINGIAFDGSKDITLPLSSFGTFTANATALSAGSAPTVSVSGTTFSFGIPKGAAGEPGPKGDKGNDGLTTAVNIGGITTQHVEGTVTIPNTSVYKAMNTGTMTIGHVVVYNTSDGQLKDGGFTISANVPANAKFTDTTYSAGTAISINNNNEILHNNYGSAGTSGPDANKDLTWESTFTVPSVTTNAQGHITNMNTYTFTMPSDPKDYTGDLAGNAATANKLKTAQSITLEGAVTGTNTFDGSENVTINTSLGDIDDGELI